MLVRTMEMMIETQIAMANKTKSKIMRIMVMIRSIMIAIIILISTMLEVLVCLTNSIGSGLCVLGSASGCRVTSFTLTLALPLTSTSYPLSFSCLHARYR